jgi:predicted peptidase
MQTRRQFLAVAAGAGVLYAIGAPVLAANGSLGKPRRATAITEVFGDGIRLTAVAIEYGQPVDGAGLAARDFHVEGRTTTAIFASTSDDPAHRAAAGRFVIVQLAPGDPGAALAQQAAGNAGDRPGKPGADKPGGGGPGNGGPGKAGSRPGSASTLYRPATATVVPPGGEPVTTSGVRNLVVDDFLQREFRDPQTGETLRYNLFVPKDYDGSRSYPLVLFMHDAGVTGNVTRATLLQGLGAIAWAAPGDQARRPCFVLAPQYEETIADDDSHTSGMLDTTIKLVNALAGDYAIDRQRLYATGQSGGCMMSIAMNIRYPDFFAASFLVAGQWDPALAKPLARQKLWILVSQDDSKAWPGQEAITRVLAQEGARISRAVWDGTWNADQYRAAFARIDAEGSPVNYVTFKAGSVIPPGQSAAGASGHRNTWRLAYSIEPIREWIFRQHR